MVSSCYKDIASLQASLLWFFTMLWFSKFFILNNCETYIPDATNRHNLLRSWLSGSNRFVVWFPFSSPVRQIHETFEKRIIWETHVFFENILTLFSSLRSWMSDDCFSSETNKFSICTDCSLSIAACSSTTLACSSNFAACWRTKETRS